MKRRGSCAAAERGKLKLKLKQANRRRSCSVPKATWQMVKKAQPNKAKARDPSATCGKANQVRREEVREMETALRASTATLAG